MSLSKPNSNISRHAIDLFETRKNRIAMPEESPTANREESPDSTAKDHERLLDKRVLQATKKGLSYFGGESIVESLLYMLELEHSVDTRRIGTNISQLRAGLVVMFGSGAYLVEKKIHDELANQERIVGSGLSLEELVEQVRKAIAH